jgi:hypothetical protein
MKFEIHYTIKDYNDFFIVEADTIEEIREKAKIETDKRGLDEVKNDLWSVELFS